MKLTEQLEFLKKIFIEFNPKINYGILFYNTDKSNAIIIATQLLKLTENDFLNIVQNTQDLKVDNVEIICCESENFNTNILTNKSYKIINKTKLFNLYFKPKNIYPNSSNINGKVLKTNWQTILKNFFLPHKAKSYFICGLVLIFSSIILPFKTYYIIFGSILLMFALICKLKKLTEN